MAETAGQPNPGLTGGPPVDVVVRYQGETVGRHVAWVDANAGQVVKAAMVAEVELITVVVAGSRPAVPGMEFAFSGEMTTEMVRL